MEVANRKAERSGVVALFVRPNGFRAVAARLTFDDRYGTGRMRRPQGGGLDADSHHQEKRCGWLDRSRQIFIITQRLHALL